MTEKLKSQNGTVNIVKEGNFYTVYYANIVDSCTDHEWHKTDKLTSDIAHDNDGVLFKADTTVHPFDKCGYLSYKNGKDFCNASGQFVGNRRFILTAAHCIYNFDSYSTTLRFSRAMSWESHKEVFTIEKAIIPKQWIDDHDRQFDYAILITNMPSSIEPLTYYINDSNANVQVTAVGYPIGGSSSNHYDMYYVEDTIVTKHNYYLLQKTTDMGYGASGGAWLRQINGDYKVVGLTSHGLVQTTGYRTFSPILSTSFSEMFDFAFKSLSENPAGYVKFKSGGGYTVEFTLKYRLGDVEIIKQTGRMLSGSNKEYDLPAGASEYEVSCRAWNGSSWKDKFDTYRSDTPFNCTFRTYGALPNPKMEIIKD